MKEQTKILGYQYINGNDALPAYGKSLECCGVCVGFCKAWLPCCGCVCCCSDPYISVPQGSQGIITQFGKYVRICESGLHYINPLSQQMIIIDCRVTVVDLPIQRLMTRDNISIAVDSCVYYHIQYPEFNYYRVQDVQSSLIKAIGGLIKNTISAFTFQQLLQKKTQITNDITYQVGPTLRAWGVTIDSIGLKNFSISPDLEAELVSAPIARRDAESKIITAQGQVEVARMLNQRSKTLGSGTAIQIRYLQTLEQIAMNPGTSMIYRSH